MSLPADAAGMADLIARLGLVSEFTVKDLLFELENKKGPPEPLIRLLERRSLLTPLQGSKLLKGETDGYFMGGYRLLYRIASGTFGKVYRGDDPRTGQVVAIKVLRKKHLDGEDRERRITQFEREGRIGLTLQHPNIVQILAVSKDPTTQSYFIVMEFVEGGNLRDILNIRKHLPLADSLRIMEECAAGLMHAYERGLTHRDIKPSNILVGTDGVSKLVDFGLAEANPISAPAGPPNAKMVKGKKGKDKDEEQADRTLEYAGLEKATNVKSGDIRSDIYFLGHCLFEMIVGEPLMERSKHQRVATEKRRFDVVEPTFAKLAEEHNLPAPVRRLIGKAITMEPTRRFQTPEQFLDAIRETRAELGVATKPKPEPEPDDLPHDDEVPHDEPTTEPAVATPARVDGPLTIVVVERNAKLQEVFRERFTKMGFRVLQSADAGQAVKYYAKHPFHAMLIDSGTVGTEGVAGFDKILAAATAANRQMVGVLIVNEGDEKHGAAFADDPRARVLIRPVTMKQLEEQIAGLVPELKPAQ